MSSISSLLHMVSTSAFFNPVSGASEEANTEAIFTLTGIPQDAIRISIGISENMTMHARTHARAHIHTLIHTQRHMRGQEDV
eukprot:scaffold268382_cov26-Tisochrysis_lutea.AAC.1